jgi:hypothetical protein
MSSAKEQQSKEADLYEGLRSRRQWKRADAERVLSDWSKSGQSMPAFARQNQLGLHRLQWWRVQLARPAAAEQTVRLVPVVPCQAPLISVESPPVAAALSVVVIGARIEISDTRQLDPTWVAKLISELRGEST